MLKDATEFDSEFSDYGAAILPCQLRSLAGSLQARSGERLLMVAVLADAINIFLKGSAERRLMADTRRWIHGGETAARGISFEDACDAVGIEPGALRQRLFDLKYGAEREQSTRRSSLMLKPPGVSRGPVKICANTTPGHGPRRRRRGATS
jgi:hypothetical protein